MTQVKPARGRPRHDPTPQQAEEIRRLHRKGRSVVRIVRLMREAGVSDGGVRRALMLLPASTRIRPFSALERQRLREWTGNESLRALAKSMRRSEQELRRELHALGIVAGEQIAHLSVRGIARLSGVSEPAIMAAIRRGELTADQRHGAWMAEPSHVREWLLARLSSIEVARVGLNRDGDEDEPGDQRAAVLELHGLLGGLWGVSAEEGRRRDRARRREGGGCLGSSGEGSG